MIDISLPYGLMMMVASVLLMRTLRHDKQVYCQRRYQIINYSIVAMLLVIAGVLSSDVFLNGCKAVFGFLYRILLKPILQLLLKVLELIIWLVYKLYELIVGEQEFYMPKDAFSIEMGESDPILEILEIEGTQEKNIWLVLLGWSLLITAIGLGLMFFFRWMNQRGSTDPASEDEIEIWETEPLPIFRPWRAVSPPGGRTCWRVRPAGESAAISASRAPPGPTPAIWRPLPMRPPFCCGRIRPGSWSMIPSFRPCWRWSGA